MKIGILKEVGNEKRVAAVPETITKFIKANWEVIIETNAGEHAFISDADYTKAGATIAKSSKEVVEQADVIIKIAKPNESEIKQLKENTTLISPLYPLINRDLVEKLNAKKITVFALDMIPRIARAQSMDILSSQSSIAGYKSIILAADHLGKLFPMMTTAAGTILPVKVMVIGAGVAGLQAIATARRLGGVVLAFDTRPIVSEQVKSLGAEFVSLEVKHEAAEDAGGYAKEQSAEFYQQEQDIIAKYIKDADVIVTTALIPGKKPPLLITEKMVAEMRPGSIIIDLAAEQGGNCAYTERDKIIVKDQVTIVGLTDLPGTLTVHASFLFAKNILAFMSYIGPQLQNKEFDTSDDIVKNCLIARAGEILHPILKTKA